MIFSKLGLDIRHPSIRRALRNCQDMHKNLMKAFQGDREQAGVLYTVMKRQDRVDVYVLSRETPDWDALVVNGYRCTGMRDISAMRDMYGEGSIFRFELLACPSKKIPGDGKNSRRVFLGQEEERKAWMERQAEKYGFRMRSLQELGRGEDILGSKGKDTIRYTAIRFSGVLEITDLAAFWDGYQSGIGPGKAYGMGMLMISRP